MKASIVIPTYKRPDYLQRLLESIAQQSTGAFEIVVVDDHSPNIDEYTSVIEKYRGLFPEFTFLRNENNRGAPYSRNRGIAAAKYDLIALVDDDDEWLPEKLEQQMAVFAGSDGHVGLVYTWTDAVDASGRVVYRYRSTIEGVPKRAILQECFIPSPSVMVRKEVILEAGLFDEALPSCQDWDMWTRIIMKGYGVRVVKKVLTLYHKHESGSIGQSARARSGYKRYFRKHLYDNLLHLNFRNVYRYFRMGRIK
ncbi:glycosyltransferase family 2 protein [Sulfurimonas sp. HSL-3221]|uniref:glycosyltransferase family 2 protein n=1 Tax=Sulfurimonadaceae TaxID=2771471 RepID=UPI001E62A812|nr:glycosyltransferase family A protein [Sulfurimonas sp. HSL-3221]UFS62405.1 glycosyltransferase family 2 protein [Sulfurimonas sp. HSL-3221]